MNNICTWLCLDQKGEESIFPQTGIISSSPQHHNIYWRCIVVFFISSKRFNKTEKHILFTNTKDIPKIDGKDIGKILKDLAVEIVYVPFTYKTPKNYFGEFQNQFYEFSILDYISKLKVEDLDQYLILDSDCFFLKPVNELFEMAFKNGGFEGITQESNPNYVINGLSVLNMKDIYEDILGRKIEEIPRYFLGEFLLCNLKNIKQIVKDFQELWPILLQRNMDGKPKFNEEAHTLSFIYFKNNLHLTNANQFIKRIWTNPVFYRNVESSDTVLTIWHLPSEKRYGFEYIYDFLVNKNVGYGFDLDNSYFLKAAYTFFSVPQLTLKRALIFYTLSYWRASKKRIVKYLPILKVKN